MRYKTGTITVTDGSGIVGTYELTPKKERGEYVYCYVSVSNKDRVINVSLFDSSVTRPYNDEMHLMLVTKYRYRYFDNAKIQNEIMDIIWHACRDAIDKKAIPLALVVDIDHIHLLYKVTDPRVYLASIGLIVSETEKRMKEKYPEIYEHCDIKKIWGGMSAIPIQDERHHINILKYIKHHQTQYKHRFISTEAKAS